MRISLIASLLLLWSFSNCNGQPETKNTPQLAVSFSLENYYQKNNRLDQEVEKVFQSLSEEERVAQMIIASLGKLGKPYEQIKPLIEQKKIGGLIFLSGDPNAFQQQIKDIQGMHKDWPMLMSMDAEPSLFNRRMPGTPEMPVTSSLQSENAVKNAVKTINQTLHEVGFQQNYAPVIDLSAENEAIGNRTFGSDSNTVIPLAKAFINTSQKNGIIATAKHFPGHGRVSGDTHKKLVYIDGEMTEAHLYQPIIDAGVLSIMVGHIAVENNDTYNTDGMPSTLSKKVVTELLRKEMNFRGLIITDAMNMGAVSEIPNCGVKAALAGCDLVLMPVDEKGTLDGILEAMKADEMVKEQIHSSVKRIIRAKICLGMNFG